MRSLHHAGRVGRRQGSGGVMIICNPGAGRGRAVWAGERVVQELPGADRQLTSAAGDARARARAAVRAGFHTVVAVGGDGTLAEVANGVLETDPTGEIVVGFLPAGTCNDFARGRTPVPPAASDGQTETVDVGRVTYRTDEGSATRYFLVNCTAGFVSDGIARFTRPGPLGRLVKRGGMTVANLAYGLTSALAFRPTAMRLVVDGRVVAHRPVLNLAVLKVPYFAGGLDFGTGVAPDDGELHAVVVDAVGRARRLALLVRFVLGSRGGRRFDVWRGRSLGVEMEPRVPIEVDGDIVGSTPARFEVLPRRLRMVTMHVT